MRTNIKPDVATRVIGALTLLIALLLAMATQAYAAPAQSDAVSPTAAIPAFNSSAALADGEPGTLVLTKTVRSDVAQPIRPGQLFTYVVSIAHVGGSAPAQTVVSGYLWTAIAPPIRETGRGCKG